MPIVQNLQRALNNFLVKAGHAKGAHKAIKWAAKQLDPPQLKECITTLDPKTATDHTTSKKIDACAQKLFKDMLKVGQIGESIQSVALACNTAVHHVIDICKNQDEKFDLGKVMGILRSVKDLVHQTVAFEEFAFHVQPFVFCACRVLCICLSAFCVLCTSRFVRLPFSVLSSTGVLRFCVSAFQRFVVRPHPPTSPTFPPPRRPTRGRFHPPPTPQETQLFTAFPDDRPSKHGYLQHFQLFLLRLCVSVSGGLHFSVSS